MNRLILILVLVCLVAWIADANGKKNDYGKWALGYAGPHDPSGNTCGFVLLDLANLDVTTSAGSGHYDIYVLAVDVAGIAESHFGLYCDGSFLFYGWTSCADTYDATVGWPGSGEGVVVDWLSEQLGPHVTMGILDVYVYGTPAKLCTSVHPDIGTAGWCDGTVPEPICTNTTAICAFGCVGFGRLGYNPMECNPVAVEGRTWGTIKALYR